MEAGMDELDKMIGGVKSFMERLSNLEGVDALGRYATPSVQRWP